MLNSYPAPQVNDAFINQKINRAYSGISYLKVSDTGKFYALLQKKNTEINYTYCAGLDHFKSKRSLKALTTIFTGLIAKYQCFECDNVLYYVNTNTGEWMWTEIE
ncbi:hypothetical protein [uncultured Aquimarina sp.]|uniref:hypothetical protein n=1 Tax=uncultured Aquimarina sp. TaxID=575652 RepID=UPI002630AB31|nr:hypothetical protein [uncultured Aquimarina sp.]